MNIIECLHTESKCYKAAQKANPVGIVVHSTGANNTSLKRYVQPSKSDPKYSSLIQIIGKNSNGNSWNRSVNKAVHYFIGKKYNGEVGIAHVLPEEYCAWGVGKGKKGSYNYNPTAHIQFEICEDNLKNETYFKACYNAAVSLCADICRRWGWEADVIVSHAEAHKKGFASNHSDIDHWLKKYKMTMNDFRNDVDALLHPSSAFAEYRVRVTAKVLNIRSGAGTNYKKVGSIKDKGVYTIVGEFKGKGATKWGKLKSGAGWISLDYCKKLD
jgi:hypothetical protein